MRAILRIVLILIILFIYGFSNNDFEKTKKSISHCGCDRDSILNSFIYCDTLHLSNNSILYQAGNCDSSWIYLTNEEGKFINLKTCYNEEILICDKLGLIFLEEYPDYLLFEYKWVSGCCDPPDVLFLDKFSGKEIRKIDKFDFISGDTEYDYLLYFTDSTYKNIELLFHKTGKKYSYSFIDNRIIKMLELGTVIFPRDIFENINLSDSYLTFDYKYLYKDKIITEKVKINYVR
jgi:hypothetical protein